MKKFLTGVLVLIYISTSTGATLHMHYCMGKLADWGFGHSRSKTCGECGMEKNDEIKSGCCKDEHKFIKSHTDQKVAGSSWQLKEVEEVALLSNYIELPLLHSSPIIGENRLSNAPPRRWGEAVYLRNRALLI